MMTSASKAGEGGKSHRSNKQGNQGKQKEKLAFQYSLKHGLKMEERNENLNKSMDSFRSSFVNYDFSMGEECAQTKRKPESLVNPVPKAISFQNYSPFEAERRNRTFTKLFDYQFNFPSSIEDLLYSDDYPDQEIVDKIKELNLDIQQFKVSDGLSIFDHAAKRGLYELSKYCLSVGMDHLKRNFLDDSPLTLAIKFRQHDVIELLTNKGYSQLETEEREEVERLLESYNSETEEIEETEL